MDVLEKISELETSEQLQTYFFIAAFIFMIFSVIGWVIELFFRRFVSTKRWINPGLLKGPYLPIYGIGVLFLTGYTFILLIFQDAFPSRALFDATVIVGIGLIMTAIELIGGLIFIKGMKIKLWDYSDRPLNFMGIICPEFSLIWTALGAAFYYLLFDPLVSLTVSFVSISWFTLAVFLMGIFYGVFLIDLIQSLEIAKKIKKMAVNSGYIVKWEAFKIHVRDRLNAIKKKSVFMSPFKTSIPLSEQFKSFTDAHKKNKPDKEKNPDDNKEND